MVSELATTFPDNIGQVTLHELAFAIVHCEKTPAQMEGGDCEVVEGLELEPTSRFCEAVPEPPLLSMTVPVTMYDPDFE